MTLQSTAQQLYVIDPMSPSSPASQLSARDEHAVSLIPPHHHHEGKEQAMSHMVPIEVSEPVDIEIVVEELPGAPPGTKDPVIEVSEEPLHVGEEEDDNDAKKGKGGKWNLLKDGPGGFVACIKERLDAVPKHSGYDSAGLERAVSYMEKLDNEISKVMRTDLDSELDADKVEKIRSQLDEGLARLHARLDKVKESKKSSRKRKKTAQEMEFALNEVVTRYTQEDIAAWVEDTSVPGEEWSVDKVLRQLANDGEEPGFETALVKTAQKITGVQGVFVTVPLLISRIARVCINGTVSAGHDIEDLYNRQVKKYSLNDREQAEVRQLLWDMGYPLREDRGFFPGDDLEVWDTDNMDWAANYRG